MIYERISFYTRTHQQQKLQMILFPNRFAAIVNVYSHSVVKTFSSVVHIIMTYAYRYNTRRILYSLRIL